MKPKRYESAASSQEISLFRMLSLTDVSLCSLCLSRGLDVVKLIWQFKLRVGKKTWKSEEDRQLTGLEPEDNWGARESSCLSDFWK
jgi:hypothetical protein